MDENGPPKYEALMGKDASVKALQDLLERFERGEIKCAALRLFKPDGTWEDIAVGGDEEEQAAALADLRSMHRSAH